MSKPIRSYPESKRAEVVARRMKQAEHGLGWLAAQDYLARKKREAKK